MPHYFYGGIMKRRLRNVWITAATPGAPAADIRGDINF